MLQLPMCCIRFEVGGASPMVPYGASFNFLQKHFCADGCLADTHNPANLVNRPALIYIGPALASQMNALCDYGVFGSSRELPGKDMPSKTYLNSHP